MSFPQDDTKRRDQQGTGENGPFPYNPIAIKIVGDGILAAALLRADAMEGEQAFMAILLALGVGIGASTVSGAMLVRSGHRLLWEVTSVACLAAMGVLLSLHGALPFGVLLGGFALWRWRRLQEETEGGGTGT